MTRYTRMIGLCALIVLAISAFAASAAQATTGPEWIVGASKTPLSGSSKVTGKLIGSAKLSIPTIPVTIECNGGSTSGALNGGNPGTDTGGIQFTECHVEGKTTCIATTTSHGNGEIWTQLLLTELVYPATNTTSALDAFYPKTGVEFAKFTLSGGATACGALNGKTLTVTATGTAAPAGGPITAGQKCGALSEVGKEKSVIVKEVLTDEFELTASGEVAELGGLRAPEPAIKAASLRDAAGTSEIKCELQTNEAASTFLGNFSQRLSTNEVFGWK